MYPTGLVALKEREWIISEPARNDVTFYCKHRILKDEFRHDVNGFTFGARSCLGDDWGGEHVVGIFVLGEKVGEAADEACAGV